MTLTDIKPTVKAAQFMLANDRSPVVSGAAMHKGEERPENVTGARYTLQDHKSFELSSEDLRSMPREYPKWKGI
jgi:hypothetical protein